MSTQRKMTLRDIMTLAWRLVKRNGFSLSEALKVAWHNAKLKAQMSKGIAKFYFRKVDGTIREAYGTLKSDLVPDLVGDRKRKPNDTVQTYYDTERQEWRCYKKANLMAM